MNDRFKFRGQTINEVCSGIVNRTWCIGSLIVLSDGKTIICPDDEIEIDVDPETVGQCTGLKDKNGKLIFEGDIIEWVRSGEGILRKGFVEFTHVLAYCINRGGDIIDWLSDLKKSDTSFEIIGNIYEDSHLIDNSIESMKTLNY